MSELERLMYKQARFWQGFTPTTNHTGILHPKGVPFSRLGVCIQKGRDFTKLIIEKSKENCRMVFVSVTLMLSVILNSSAVTRGKAGWLKSLSY